MSKRSRAHVNDDQLAFDLRVKWCARCEQERPAWDFTKNKRRSDGLTVYCRSCWNSYIAERGQDPIRREELRRRSNAWYEQNGDEIRARRTIRRHERIDEVRARSRAFYHANREKERQRALAYYQANREKIRERGRAYYLANVEKVRAQHRAWKRANKEAVRACNRAWVEANREAHRAKGHRRRARMAQVQTIPFSVEQLLSRWSYYGNKCWICGDTATATDHVKPISKGGAHMLCNLRPICKPCNSAKHNKWPFEIGVIRGRSA